MVGIAIRFTHLVEPLDYKHHDVSCKALDLVPLGLIDERFRQSLDYLFQIETSGRGLFCIMEGENNTCFYQEGRGGGEVSY